MILTWRCRQKRRKRERERENSGQPERSGGLEWRQRGDRERTLRATGNGAGHYKGREMDTEND